MQIEAPHSMQPGGFPLGHPGPLLAPVTPEKLPGWMPRGPPPAPPLPRFGGAAGSSGVRAAAAVSSIAAEQVVKSSIGKVSFRALEQGVKPAV